MQLKWKKIGILSTFFVYCASFLIQSNFVLFQTWAQEVNIPRVNIVAILVDEKIYKGIESGLERYASDYIQGKLADTKALVIPLDLADIKAYDIYRMMENIYFDGLENTNSSLIGLIMFGDIPLPVVNQDGYVFPTVYPYVDFENQKYLWDEESHYFVANNNPLGQAEIWHGLVNYGDDIGAYLKFFTKIKKYVENPDNFIGDSMWYEDFIAQKEAFKNEDYQYYRNKIMFGEDIGYQRYGTLMRSMFGGESANNSAEIVSELDSYMDSDLGGLSVVNDMLEQGSNSMHTTKMVQQEIETSYLADYNEIFSKSILSTIRENIFAGGRRIKLHYGNNGKVNQIVDADSSTSKIQIKDTMYLGNDDLQGLLENFNLLMEEVVDKKIDKNRYDMDIVIPVSYKQITGKRIDFKCYHFVSRFDNYYFGSNARYIDKASDLSLYRGTYRNLSNLSGVTFDSLKTGNNPIIGKYDPVNVRMKSIGASYGIFSNQAEGNKGYGLLTVETDLDVYNAEKTAKKSDTYRSIFGKVKRRVWPEFCDDEADDEDLQCENLYDFAQRWWGGASPINLDNDSISRGRYVIKGYKATDAWRQIYDMQGFQSLLSGEDEGSLGTGWITGTGTGPQWDATNFKAYVKYSSPTQREGWKRVRWLLIGRGYEVYENHTPDVHIDFDDMNYWGLPLPIINSWEFSKESEHIFNIDSKRGINSCGMLRSSVLSEQYKYKVIRSIVKHVSTTEDEINGIDRDKYGESGKLWNYYMDLKNSYGDIASDMSEIIDGLSGLKLSINTMNGYINDNIKSLNAEGTVLSNLVTQYNKLQLELQSLKDRKTSLELEKKKIEEEGGDVSVIITSISQIEKDIKDKERELTLKGQEKSNSETGIEKMLDEIDKNITMENKQLSDVYRLVMSLFPDNIITLLEYIVYMEGGNPEEFYNGNENLNKLGLLKSRISEILDIEDSIKSDSKKVIDYYEEVFSLIKIQQSNWATLAQKLKDISEENSEKIDEVSAKVRQIFVVSDEDSSRDLSKEGKNHDFREDLAEQFDSLDEDSDDGDDENEKSVFTLTKDTASNVINGENGLIDKFEGTKGVDEMFSWTIKEDEVGEAIINAAKSDDDFLLWLYENETGEKRPSNFLLQRDFDTKFSLWSKSFVKSGKFSDTDWINQYAQRAEGPGYDSEGAKKNHDLLMGVSEHMSGMNILTADRPIDSPRYISMQSVAGRDTKFIYPDLFKVEVYILTGKNKSGYDMHELLPAISLTGLDIRKRLVKYLEGKVDEYNKILDEECGAALEMDEYFKKLKKLGYEEATPELSVHNCGVRFEYDEFLEALGGEEMLDVIAEVLYYQNLTNKKKLSSKVVTEDIKFIKKSFTLNDKREETLKDYLIEGNEKKKDPVFVIPTYELYGYEVGFVNSNGRDYIIPEDDNPEDLNGLTQSSQSSQSNQSSLRKIVRKQETQQESDLNDECNIPSNGRLPLFKLSGLSVSSPWFKGFKCWLKKTLKDPVKIKLRFDSSFGEILSADSLSDYIKSSEYGQYLTDYGDAWTRYADAWDVIIDPDADHDSDKEITQKQVDAEKHNQEVTAGGDVNSNVLASFLKNLKITNPTTLLSDSTPSSELMISSLIDLGNITVVFSSMGDGCIKLDNDELCNGRSVTKIFNPKKSPFVGVVTSADHVAGKVALDMKIILGDQYIKKIVKYTVSPSVLDRAEINLGDNKTIAGMITPVEVIGYDKYNNRISWGIEKYNFIVSQGEFLKDGSYQKSFETNDFRNLRFYYHAPLDAEDNSEAIIQISKVNDPSVYISTYRQRVVQAAPEIKLNGVTILKGKNDLVTNQVYRLKDNEDIYIGDKLSVPKLQKLEVAMKDGNGNLVDIDSQILVTSQKGLVVVGQVQKKENGDNMFFETSRNYMTGGYAIIYYYPTTVAGEDVINIDIPGLDTRMVNLSVKPASLVGIQIVPEDDVVEVGDTIDIELFGFDVWGNLVDGVRDVSIGFDDDKIEFLNAQSAEDVLHTTIDNGYRKLTVLGLEGGLTYLIEGSTYTSLYVDKHIFPNSGLNIMYLNYFGDDWGNQWGYFSDNDKYIEDLMKKSNKVITTTTQLVSQDKIKKMIWKIQPGFKIWNPDNTSTVMTINGKYLEMIIGGVSTMRIPVSSPNIMSVSQDTMNNLLNKDSSAGKNYIFFIPSEVSYSIKNGNLYKNDELLSNVVGGEVTFQLVSSVLDNGDNVWNLVDRGINYGKLVIHYPSFMPMVSYFTDPGERYLASATFTDGSTDSLTSVGVFDELSDFELNTNYKSIQNSDEVRESIGFLGDFKNITLFAEGEIVGEATKKYGSEFVINLGDPVLSRKDKNEFVKGTNFDGGIGNEIFVDSENDIFGTYQIDFDGNGSEDLLVIYLDGKVKLSKNYGGTPDLRNMQELMRVAVNIQDVYVGDVDGNGYDDILVLTANNQLRAYLNDRGMFDVDGSLVCLNQNVFEGEISETPHSLEGIFQLFVEDMDMDGITDIITYDDKGYIKVFYGGSTNGGPNYLSKEKYMCDSGWYNREIGNTTIVAALGIQVVEDSIFDNSLMHWVGMKRPEVNAGNLSQFGVYFNPGGLVGEVVERKYHKDGDITQITNDIMENFDERQAGQKYTDLGAKYVDVSLYENILMDGGTLGGVNNYVFAPSSFLDPNDPSDICSVRKNYRVKSGSSILQDGDIVTVRVTVKASDLYPCHGSYGDMVQGPRNIYFDEDKIFKGIKFILNKRNAVVKKRDGNFTYIIDNITLNPTEKMIFEYDLEYHRLPLRKMSISYKSWWSEDDIPDIKMQSVDGCAKDYDVYVGLGKRMFLYKLIPLQEMIDEEYLLEEEKSEDFAEKVIGVGSNVNQLPGIVGNTINRRSLLGKSETTITDDDEGKKNLKNVLLQKIEEGGLESLNVNVNLELSVFEEEMDKIEDIIDDITKGMCNGFSFGGSSNCKGLPVPFNQAFLAPGKYHIFGCWDLPLAPLDGGVPVFHFPGTMYVAGAPIPIPWGLKGPGDDFLWVPGGEYPSFIRIYAAPTLTAQLGIAICMGPYSAGASIPSPFADIGGNCIVFAIKPQCKGEETDPSRKSDPDNPNEVYDKIVEDARNSGVCLQSQKGFMVTLYGNRSTPFNLYSYRSRYNKSSSPLNQEDDRDWLEKTRQRLNNNVDVSGGSNNGVQYSASLMGVIELETSSFIGRDEYFEDSTKNSIVIGDVDILGGTYDVNKIRGGLQQGVRKLLIDKRLDPQIRYILNQLTKMHINIKFPDVSNMIDYEVQTMKNVAENIGKIWESSDGNKDWYKPDFLTSWSSITQENLNTYNKSIANPFEALANLMNESNIINISMEPLTVKIPMIFSEDINGYEVYLKQWLEVNKGIIDDWKSVLNALVTSCPKDDQECRAKASENLNAFIEFEQGDWQKMLNQIYANLMILQKYRNFPFEVYERIHVIDRYMSEIASLINNTIGYLAYWTSTNAERFVGYVDAIVLILNIIRTYQVLIDFSIEWGQNCGNCTKDTYDQYSCKLSMLCDMIQLPIIQIPNFKLPNITIDLTNIDIGLDIILPEFNFQPVKVNLPDLPNLPEPPSIGINIKLLDLPNIPMLPEPPELPELPSFIPEVELELPILPPAPEVPKLPNTIEGILKVAKLIGKIYCIVKGGFGLVGEKSVKAKIEQLTQRTYEVKRIDTIMDFTTRSPAPIKNYGVDYEIDSYVDLQFNFRDFYDYLDTLTKSINNLTTSSVNWLSDQTDKMVNDNKLVETLNSIDGASIDIDMTILDLDRSNGNDGIIGMNSSLIRESDLVGLMSDDIEYVDYESGKNRLKDVLTFFRQETTNTILGDSVISSISKIENQINRPNVIRSNVDGLDNIKNEVNDYLNKKRINYDELAQLINDNYDGFLAMVDAQYNNSVKYPSDEKLLTFNTQLFAMDSSTKETIKNISKDNPYDSLLDNKKTIIDGYWNAINTNSADDLGLTQKQYLVLRDNISSMRNQMNRLYSFTRPVSSTNLIAKDSGLSANKSLIAGLRLADQTEVVAVVDPSVMSKGIYERVDGGWNYTKVIYSYSFSERMQDTYHHTTHTDVHDIVLWDKNAIYKKCYDQSCINYGGSYGGYYVSKEVVREIPYKETWLSFDDGMRLKIADKNEEVKNRKVIGQTYDVLSFLWKKSEADAYLIKLVERIDYSYEKVDYSLRAPVKYVLALPNTINLESLYRSGVKLELLNKKIDLIENLSGKDLVQVVYYDPYKSDIVAGISNIERKWYYARVSALNLLDGVYYIDSPWSNQVVAGRQIVGDDQAPSGNPVLYRPTTNQIVSEGDDLEGYVGTRYKLIINWEDNVALSYINLMKDGKILDEKYTSEAKDTVSVDIDIHTKSEKETYTTMGIDQYGYKTEKFVTVSYYIPDITITDLSKNADGETIAIIAELSQDIDQGNVSFQRRRGEVWKTMKKKGVECADLAIGPGDWTIVGSPYSAGNEIAMYDKNGEVMALMNPNTAEIKLQSGYLDSYEVRVSVQNSSVLNVCNTGTQNPMFSISIPTESCIKIEAEGYTIVDLPEEGKMGMFNGGKAVYKDGTNILFASPTCHLYSELGLQGTYGYDRELDAVVLTLYQLSDLSKKNPIKVWLKVKPFLEN